MRGNGKEECMIASGSNINGDGGGGVTWTEDDYYVEGEYEV